MGGNLGDRIRSARTQKGWKQKHLASHVNVEPITVSRWERGATTPDLDTITLVAEATGKPISYFVDDARAASAAPASLGDAAERIERAAERIADETERLADLLVEVRAELEALRGRL